MFRTFLVLTSLFLFSSLRAQVVIDSASMPKPGDIPVLRRAQSANGIDYTLTGTNFTWDFSTLTGQVDVADTFVSVYSTPLTYNIAFSNPFDPIHFATVGVKQPNMSLVVVQITDAYSFLKTTSTQFSEVGVGEKISGIPIPMQFDHPDVKYNFPITYSTIDSSDSKLSANLPTLGYYSLKRHRVNYVDGWGTLYLPNDTFNVMRIKSILHSTDSVYLDTIGMGFHLNRAQTEYIWLTPGHHAPVLQVISTTGYTNIKYFSSTPIGYGVDDVQNFPEIEIYPNPATDILTVNLTDNSLENRISILDITGKEIYSKVYENVSKVDVPLTHLAKGFYLIRISNRQQSYCRKFVKE